MLGYTYPNSISTLGKCVRVVGFVLIGLPAVGTAILSMLPAVAHPRRFPNDLLWTCLVFVSIVLVGFSSSLSSDFWVTALAVMVDQHFRYSRRNRSVYCCTFLSKHRAFRGTGGEPSVYAASFQGQKRGLHRAMAFRSDGEHAGIPGQPGNVPHPALCCSCHRLIYVIPLEGGLKLVVRNLCDVVV